VSKKRKTVCLCMMVRNEERIIGRALDSALPHIDAWSVLDTGSDDLTCSLVMEHLAKLPGQLHREEWVDFATGRTSAMVHALQSGCDYILVMDADQTLGVQNPHWRSGLTLDGYNVQIHHGDITYPHPWLLSAKYVWKWDGKTHEALTPQPGQSVGELTGVYLVEHADSSRRQSGVKAREDRALLEQAYADDPTDARTVFYLAQVCQDEGRIPCAIKHYEERVRLGGWIEEAWCAQYRIGRLREATNMWPMALEAYLAAWNMHPDRAEPLYRLGRGELMHKRPQVAILFFGQCLMRQKPTAALFVEEYIYDYAAMWGMAMCLRLLGDHTAADPVERGLLEGGSMPDAMKKVLEESREAKKIPRLP
jgi:tetratricopeptide (TPR) repeat protein